MTSISRRADLFILCFAMLIGSLGTTMMSPLFVVYRDLWHLDVATISSIYVLGAVTVLVLLLVCRRITDALGAVRCLKVSLLVAVIGQILFLLADDLAMVYLARAISASATGLVAMSGGIAVAMVVGDDARRAGTLSSLATVAGFASGPLLSGVIEWATATPLVNSFATVLALSLLSLLSLMRLPAGSPVNFRLIFSVPRMDLPRVGTRGHFLLAGMAFFVSSGVFAIMATAMPVFLRELSDIDPVLLSGFGLGCLFVMAMLGQTIVARLSIRLGYNSALGLLVIGCVMFAVAFTIKSVVLFMASVAIIGFAHGEVITWGYISVNRVTDLGDRAGVFSFFLVLAYIGASLPPLVVGAIADRLGQMLAIDIFAGAIVLSCLILWLCSLRTRLWDCSVSGTVV